MGITFDGTEIPGSLAPLILPPPEVQRTQTQFWGVKGESVILGKSGGRSFQLDFWLYDREGSRFSSADKITQFIEQTLNDVLLGTTGTLSIDTPSNWPDLQDVTFLGASVTNDPGVIEDVAGTLGGDWMASLILNFRQHRSGE